MVAYTKNNLLSTPALGEVHFLGSIGEKFDRVIYERITSDKAKNVIFKEAESAFINCIDDKDAPLGIWQGEFWGKLMISACRVCRYINDASLRSFIRESVQRIMDCQREDGYIGTYKDPECVFQIDPKIGKSIVGWNCNWNWNIWCRKYTLWGLLEAYELLCDDDILDSASRFAEQLVTMLENMEARLCETGTFFGAPSSSIMKPMLILYRHTGNKRFLNFALSIAEQWEDNETCCSKIISSPLEGTPPQFCYFDLKQTEPVSRKRVNGTNDPDAPAFDSSLTIPETSGKVYETLSCYDGLLELYRVTGNKKYLTATEKFFELLIKYEYNTLFSVGFNDVFLNARNVQNSITELCDVIHFMRLATELYKLTAEPRYIDFTELAFFNPFLAGVTHDGTWGARGVRASERHMYSLMQAGFHYNHCCVNNMPRGFINIAETIAVSDKNSVYVNLYGESRVTLHPTEIENVTIAISGGFSQYCEVDIAVEATLSDAKTLYFRIPQWSIDTEITADGKTSHPTAGEYAAFRITSGKASFHIAFDKTPRLVDFDRDIAVFPLTPYMRSRYVEEKLHEDTIITEKKSTLCVGATLLSMSKKLGSTKEEIFDRKTVCGKGCECTVTPHPQKEFDCAFDVSLNIDGKTSVIPMGDFASASDSLDPEEYSYSIFI